MGAVSSFFRSFFGGSRDSAEVCGVKQELIARITKDPSERGRLERKSFPDLVCDNADVYADLLRQDYQNAVVALWNLSDAHKRAFVEKAGGRILQMLNGAGPALCAAIIDLLLALPDGLVGRIKSLLGGRRPQSESEEALRQRVGSELIDGFSKFPAWAAKLFISDNAEMFISLFRSSHKEVVAIASIILASAPGDIRDALVISRAKLLLETIAFAPFVSGLTSVFLQFFPSEGREAAKSAMAFLVAVRSAEFVFEWLPRLSSPAKEAIFANAFNEFYFLVLSSVGDLNPGLAARRVGAIMDGVRTEISPATCSALVAGKESPLAFLLGESRQKKGEGGVSAVAARTMIPYLGDSLRRASPESQYSFAIQNPKVFFESFDPPRGELFTYCSTILQAMPEGDRRPFIWANADMFLQFALFSPLVGMRFAALRLIEQRCESFLSEHGDKFIERLSTCEDREVREFIIKMARPFCSGLVRQHGETVVGALLGAADPGLPDLGIRWIETLDEFSLRGFFVSHANAFLAHLGCFDEKKASLVTRMLAILGRFPGAIVPQAVAAGLGHCCLSPLPVVRDFASEQLRGCDSDVRAEALGAGVTFGILSVLHHSGSLERLRSLLDRRADSWVDAVATAFSLLALDEIVAKGRSAPGGKLLSTRKFDQGALFEAVAALSPDVQGVVLSDNGEALGLFFLGLVAAFVSQAQGAADELRTFYIPLLVAHSPSVRAGILGKIAENLGWKRARPEKPLWKGLQETWGPKGVGRQYFDRIFTAAGFQWNAMLEGLPADQVAYLAIPLP
jgi:hypothetical protein